MQNGWELIFISVPKKFPHPLNKDRHADDFVFIFLGMKLHISYYN